MTPQRRYYIRNRKKVIARSRKRRLADPKKRARENEATRKLRDRKRRARLAELKAVPCHDCGGLFPTVCMDFDHVRGRKKFTITDRAGHYKWETILKEVAKCEIVCSNCHRLRTQRRKKR